MTERERLYKQDRRITAINSAMEELEQNCRRFSRYPGIFGVRDVARQRHIALRKIEIILRTDWDG